jgi:hypothetical protein
VSADARTFDMTSTDESFDCVTHPAAARWWRRGDWRG